MQHELKFPAQCAVIPSDEQAWIVGGAETEESDWWTELKTELKPAWEFTKELFSAGVTCGRAFLRIYFYCYIIKDSLSGIKKCIVRLPW